MSAMTARLATALALLALAAGPAGAGTLRDVLTARGIEPPPGARAHLDAPVQASQLLDDERGLLVVYALEGDPTGLHAIRVPPVSRTATAVPIRWPAAGGAPSRIEPRWCGSGLALTRLGGDYLVRAHINPSAECTVILGLDLTLRAVLAGWPVATLATGPIVYQRNQVHFAAVHPVALALYDPRRRTEVALYPRTPYQSTRRAHQARLRTVYTEAWCRAHNHPCDPAVFDEQVAGGIATDPSGDRLAFVMAWDNTAGWSDAERWGRLEAFRELRAALAPWDGQGPPPDSLYRGLAAGLGRTRNLAGDAHVAAALAGQPALRDLVVAALAGRPAAGQSARSWLTGLDARWDDPATWRQLGSAVQVPDEFTDVVYLYRGLRQARTLEYRETPRRDFEVRFGPGAPARALAPDVVRELFASPPR